MSNMVKISAKVSLSPRDIVGVSDVIRLDGSVLVNAIDLSGGAKRTAVFMSSGTVFLIELKVDTLLRRLENMREPKPKK